MQEYKFGAWVPVAEALPDDDDLVLVTCETKSGHRSINRAYYDGQFWHGSGSMSGVTAWMPLPEPYEEHSMEEFMQGQDPGDPEDGRL